MSAEDMEDEDTSEEGKDTPAPASDASDENGSSELAAALAQLKEKGAEIKGAEIESDSDVADAASATSTTTVAAKQEGSLVEASKQAKRVYVIKHDAWGRAYATGKRKNSIARVWVKRGTGKFKVNGKEIEKYFAREVLRMIIRQPFETVNCADGFDVMCTAKGGGLSGQAGALKHGISRALCRYDTDFRAPLKSAGFLTRDARIVERKKYGKPKARRSFQFSKR